MQNSGHACSLTMQTNSQTDSIDTSNKPQPIRLSGMAAIASLLLACALSVFANSNAAAAETSDPFGTAAMLPPSDRPNRMISPGCVSMPANFIAKRGAPPIAAFHDARVDRQPAVDQ